MFFLCRYGAGLGNMSSKDLTIGKPLPVIWRFCLPLFGSILFQQLYNIADSFVAGKFIGEEALASVSNSYEITLIFIAINTGLNIGCSVIVASYFGAREYERLKTSVWTTFITGLTISAVLMILGLTLTPALLRAIKTPEGYVFENSKLYMDIYIWGVPFLMLYNVSAGIFTALGDSKTTFIFLALSSTVNIFMDIFFVVVLNMGVSGVAWATFICQGVSAILSLIVIMKRLREVPSTPGVKTVYFSFPILKNILKVAIPSMLQQRFVSVGNILVQSVINSFGAVVMAGYGAAIKIHNTLMNALKTFSDGITSFSAQNLGARKYRRIYEGWKSGFLLTMCFALPISIIVFIFPNNILSIFLPKGPSMDEGRAFLRIVAPFYAVISIKWTTDGVLRGTRHMRRFMIATFADLILRVGLAFLLPYEFGSTGIWLSWPLGWVVGTAISFMLAWGIMRDFNKRGNEDLKVQSVGDEQ